MKQKRLEHFGAEVSRYLLMILLLGVLLPQSLLAKKSHESQRPITGKVTGANGDPLAGATINVKESQRFTTTDAKGEFTIDVESGNTLVISYSGYEVKEVTVGNEISITITLTQSIKALEDVVVIGYGTQRRSNISGAVSVIKERDIAKNPAANLTNSLVGQSPGIIAVQRSGEPGRDQSDIFIRGVGTTGNTSPLYVIDGIVSSSSDFAQLNVNEIENVSILKDAASAAVFGVRGGNGVVLVTTKRGDKGRANFSYNYNYGIQQRTRTPKFLNSFDYATLYNEAAVNDGATTPPFTQDALNKFRDGSDPNGFPNTDWYKTVLKASAPMQQHNISANGGTDKTRYAVSFSYLNQEGIYNGSGFKRFNFRSNLDADATRTTRISFDISARNENSTAAALSASDVFYGVMRARPTDPAIFTNGLYSITAQGNPLASIQSSEGYERNTFWVARARAQVLQSIPFIKGLSMKVIAAFDKNFSEQKRWRSPSIPLYKYNPSNQSYTVSLSPALPSLDQFNQGDQGLTLEGHLNYENTFGKHKVGGLLLYTQTEGRFSGLYAGRNQYTIRVDELQLGPVNAGTYNGGYSGASGRQGVVGRLNYAFDNKYIVEASFRNDGSEQFAPGRRWGFFPSFSAAWVLSNEKFFDNIHVVNNLKLRGSWGVLGNDRLNTERFFYLSTFAVGPAAIFGNNNVAQTIYEGRFGNSVVTWETVKKMNVGLDATVFNGMIDLTADYFEEKRDDILASRSGSVPALTGFSLPVENIAKVDNKGIELSIGHTKAIGKSFSYNIRANFTHAKNEVVFIDEPAGVNPNLARTGRPIGSQFGLLAIGIFQNTNEIGSSPSQSAFGTTKPGDIKYADISGPDGKPDGKVDDNDRTFIGNSNIPQNIFGFNAGIRFKGLEFSFLFQGASKVNQYLNAEAAWPFYNGGNALASAADRWTPATPNSPNPRLSLISSPTAANYRISSYWMRDVSYLRLRNIEVAYNLPQALTKKAYLNGLRLYINANNVFTLTKLKYFDPENSNPRASAYPQLRVFNFGATIQF